MMRVHVEEPMSENDASISFRDDIDLNTTSTSKSNSNSQDATKSAAVQLEDLDDLVRERHQQQLQGVSMQSEDSPSSLVTKEGCWKEGSNNNTSTGGGSSSDQVFRLLPRSSSTNSSFNTSPQRNSSGAAENNGSEDAADDVVFDDDHVSITSGQQEHGECSCSGDSLSRSSSMMLPLHKKDENSRRGIESVHSGSTTDPELSCFPRDDGNSSEDGVIGAAAASDAIDAADAAADISDLSHTLNDSILSDTMGCFKPLQQSSSAAAAQPASSPPPTVPFSRSSTPTVPFTLKARPSSSAPPAGSSTLNPQQQQLQQDDDDAPTTPPRTPPISPSSHSGSLVFLNTTSSSSPPVTPTADDALSVLTCFEDNNKSLLRSPRSPSPGAIQPSLPDLEPEADQQQLQGEDTPKSPARSLIQLPLMALESMSAPNSPLFSTDVTQQQAKSDSKIGTKATKALSSFEKGWIQKAGVDIKDEAEAPTKSPFPIPPPPSHLGWRAVSDPNLATRRRSRSHSVPAEPTSTASPLPTSSSVMLTPRPKAPLSPGNNNNSATSAALLTAPRSPSYNPYTNYSPGRNSARKRHEVMGMSILAPLMATHPDAISPRYRTAGPVVEPADDSSVDSEEMLERCAAHIRAELRHAEMFDLALEAERAAEAGEERFKAQPFSYGHEDTKNNDSPNNAAAGEKNGTEGAGGLAAAERPTTAIRRHASYSEGLTPMRRSRGRDNRIAVRDLRDVDEVLPSFQTFHNNLRTHFARSNVPEDMLIFEEIDDIVVDSATRPPSFQLKPSPQMRSGKRMSFLNTFSFDILRASAQVADEMKGKGDGEDNGDDGPDIGDLLAEHIHSEDPGQRRRPTLEKLPGLHEPCSPCSKPFNKAIEEENDADLDNTSEKLLPRTTISPRALFDQDEDSYESDNDTLDTETLLAWSKQQSPSTPVLKSMKSIRGFESQGPDFLTPARLREIRGHKNMTEEKITAMLDKDNLLLSVNSVLQESPIKKVRLKPSSEFVAREGKSPPPNKLLLPTLPRGPEENTNAERAITLRPSMAEDSLDRRIAPPSIERETSSHPPDQIAVPESQSTPQAPKVFPVRRFLDNEISSPAGSVSSAKRKDKTRRVKVSIFCSSPSKERGDRTESLQTSHFVSLERNDSNDDSATSAPSDCACLNLAPALSLETLDDLRDDDDDKQHPAPKAIHNNPDLSRPVLPMPPNCDQTRTRPIAAAMHMLSKFSPKKQSRLHLRSKELFVRPKENDDFMQNYLYCSRPQSPRSNSDAQKEVCSSNDPCQEGDRFCEDTGGALMSNLCGAFMTDRSFIDKMMPRRAAAPQLLLSRKSSNSRTDQKPETWFDVATGGVDVMIERFVGNGQPKPFNRSFQPPSLRKSHPATEGGSASAMGIDDSNNSSARVASDREESFQREVSGCDNESSREEEKKFDGPLVQALFEAPQEDLSDTQFALIYGVSRDQFQKLSGRRRRGGGGSSSKGGTRLYALNGDGELDVKRQLSPSFSAANSTSSAPFYGSSLSTANGYDKDTGLGGARDNDEVGKDADFFSKSY